MAEKVRCTKPRMTGMGTGTGTGMGRGRGTGCSLLNESLVSGH